VFDPPLELLISLLSSILLEIEPDSLFVFSKPIISALSLALSSPYFSICFS
jgi:hypothetical protein